MSRREEGVETDDWMFWIVCTRGGVSGSLKEMGRRYLGDLRGVSEEAGRGGGTCALLALVGELGLRGSCARTLAPCKTG